MADGAYDTTIEYGNQKIGFYILEKLGKKKNGFCEDKKNLKDWIWRI